MFLCVTKSHPCKSQVSSFLCVKHHQRDAVLTPNYTQYTSRGQHTSFLTHGSFPLRLEQWCVCTSHPCVLPETLIDRGHGATNANLDLCVRNEPHWESLWFDASAFMTYKCITVPCGLTRSCLEGLHVMCGSSIQSHGFR